MSMTNLQVRNLPEELHRKLSERARTEGVSMSEYVTRLLRSDLERPTFTEWAGRVRGTSGRKIDVVNALDAARDDYDPQ